MTRKQAERVSNAIADLILSTVEERSSRPDSVSFHRLVDERVRSYEKLVRVLVEEVHE